MHTDILKKIYLFSGLNKDELNMLKEITRIKKFSKGDIIFFDTEPYRGFYILLEGLVKIYKISKDGREHILHIIEPNNTFAEVPLFENLDILDKQETDDSFRYPANSMALEDGTEAAFIPANKFKTMLEQNSSICMKMLSGFSKRLRHLSRHIEELTLMDVTKRTANFIYFEYINKRKSKTGSGKDSEKDVQAFITLNISKNDLASYLGTIIETLSRTFKKLQAEGLIEVEGKKIIIKDLEKLKKLTL